MQVGLAAIAAIGSLVSPADVSWLQQNAARLVNGSRLAGVNGTTLYTPDASSSYGAQWTRDFAYMLAEAPDVFDWATVRPAVLYTLNGVRSDGAVGCLFPDRVTAGGAPVYSPGSGWVDHAMDNNPFGALLVATYVRHAGDAVFFCAWEPTLRRAFDYSNRSAAGLLFNDPVRPNCTYGFTDTVAKTGHLLFTSLLYFQAARAFQALALENGCGNASDYGLRADLIAANVGPLLWDAPVGMFFAADIDCKQHDVWGSAFAVSLGVTTPDQAAAVAAYLVAHAEDIFQRGQVRHLVAPEVWQRCIEGACPAPGTYQNGAFWATPLAWVLPVLVQYGGAPGAALAQALLAATVADFRANGTQECVNGAYHGVPDYVDSGTATYAAAVALQALQLHVHT